MNTEQIMAEALTKANRTIEQLVQERDELKRLMGVRHRQHNEREDVISYLRYETDLCQQALESLKEMTAERDAANAALATAIEVGHKALAERDAWEQSCDEQIELLNQIANERDRLTEAIKKTHTAKGRYHSQIAMCDLYDLVGLKNERPSK